MYFYLAAACVVLIAVIFAVGLAIDYLTCITPDHPGVADINWPLKTTDTKEIERRE